MSNRMKKQFLSLPRWSLLGPSVLVPLILLALVLLSASIVAAEPLRQVPPAISGVAKC